MAPGGRDWESAPISVRLFRAPWSTNVERVALALAHKGVEVESVMIDYADRSPVLEVSGQPLVPVLDDDGVVVADSYRILHHLEATRPEPPLFPRDPAARAHLDVFMEWFEELWKVAPNTIEDELDGGAPDPAVIAAHAARMDARLDLFEDMLAGSDPGEERSPQGRSGARRGGAEPAGEERSPIGDRASTGPCHRSGEHRTMPSIGRAPDHAIGRASTASFLLSDAFSAADCVAFPFLKYAAGRDPADDETFHRVLDDHQSLEGRPRLAAWIERVDSRPRV